MRDDPPPWRDRFFNARVAVLGSTSRHRGGPHLVPIVFADFAGFLVSAVDHKPKRTAQLARLDNVRADPRVSLLAHSYDDDWERLWWVRADGVATIYESGDRFEQGLDALQQRYDHYTARRPEGPLLVVEVEHWTGWSSTGWSGAG